MRKDFQKLFNLLEPVEPPEGLFDRIILAIKKEKELKQSKKLLFNFLFLLIISLSVTPFSGVILVNQIKSSGIVYFISLAISDLKTFFFFWQDFSLAILESLPIVGITIFLFSLVIFIFTLRLFLSRKKLLLKYLIKNI